MLPDPEQGHGLVKANMGSKGKDYTHWVIGVSPQTLCNSSKTKENVLWIFEINFLLHYYKSTHQTILNWKKI